MHIHVIMLCHVVGLVSLIEIFVVQQQPSSMCIAVVTPFQQLQEMGGLQGFI